MKACRQTIWPQTRRFEPRHIQMQARFRKGPWPEIDERYHCCPSAFPIGRLGPVQSDCWRAYPGTSRRHGVQRVERVCGVAEHGQGGAYPEEGTRSQLSTTQVGCKEKDHHPELVGEIEISQRTG